MTIIRKIIAYPIFWVRMALTIRKDETNETYADISEASGD